MPAPNEMIEISDMTIIAITAPGTQPSGSLSFASAISVSSQSRILSRQQRTLHRTIRLVRRFYTVADSACLLGMQMSFAVHSGLSPEFDDYRAEFPSGLEQTIVALFGCLDFGLLGMQQKLLQDDHQDLLGFGRV